MAIVRRSEPQHVRECEKFLGLVGVQDETGVNARLICCRNWSFTGHIQLKRLAVEEGHVPDKDPSLMDCMDQGIGESVSWLNLRRFSIFHIFLSRFKSKVLFSEDSGDDSPSQIQRAILLSTRPYPGDWESAPMSVQSQKRRRASMRGSGGVSWIAQARMYEK